jgi:hypothetical protein
MGKRTRGPSRALKGRLQAAVRSGRRETIYKMLGKQNDGVVPCFVCGLHVEKKDATLEHKLPVSKGGTDDMDNLSISHEKCNRKRGNSIDIEELKMKTHTGNYYFVPGTDELEVELPIEPSGMAYREPLVRIEGDQIVLGYLAHDDCAEDPLENDDYAGHIYEARRNGPTLRQYEQARGLGRYKGEAPDPYAVLLDVYEHGGIAYSLSGTGQQCQFDTARGGAVWVPGDLLRADIEASADPAARARECARIDAEQYTAWRNGDCYLTVVVTYDKDGEQIDLDTCGGYYGGDSAYEALQEHFPKEEVPA